MNRVNIHDAKTHLSEYLENLREGDTIVLCKRNKPVAEIRALPRPYRGRRPVGLAKNKLKVPKSFFQPLPGHLLDAFEGRK